MKHLVSLLMATAIAGPAFGQTLEQGFASPPDAAKPRAWWQWMNGNVTREGVTLDLEWMKRVGFGGVQWFDVAIGVPQIVDKRIAYGSDDWRAMARFAAAETDRLGLEMTIVGSPGWSESGGPWVKPEGAMKKVVWAETRVSGPGPAGRLKAPPTTSGPYQDIAATPFEMAEIRLPGAKPTGGKPPAVPSLYRDIRVLAWPAPQGDVAVAALKPVVTTSAETLDAGMLSDGDLVKKQVLDGARPGKPAWVQYDFGRPQTVRAAVLGIGTGGAFGGTSIPEGTLEASDDGKTWRRLATLPGPFSTSAPTRTLAFPAVTARYFRAVFTSVPPNPMAVFGAASAPHYDIGELSFEPGPRVNRAEEKAGYGTIHEVDTLATPEPGPAAIDPAKVLDLTDRLRPDGTLDWKVPRGEWVVMRLGASLTGKLNTPSPVEGQGLEADKFSKAHMTAYLDGFIAPLLENLKGHTGDRGFRSVMTDSWEAGQQNWTDDMLGEFQRRRGYDAAPWLPALAGRVIGGGEATDRFLWDWRRTIADLIAENHYGTIADYLHARGLKLYGEATGVKMHTNSDGIQAKSYVDYPMGEFWLVPIGAPSAPEHVSDIREAASTAHVYGKPLVAAEAFTDFPYIQDPWTVSPWTAKGLADRFMALGVNQFMVSTSVHQPLVGKRPGVTLGPFGQYFTRNQTWAEQAGPWVGYLARSSYMLQQGRTVSDIAVFYGEGVPATAPYLEPQRPEMPAGYAWDYLDAGAILKLMSVKDGMLVTPSGQSYRMLVLPQALTTMTLPLVEKIHDLVSAGATVVGPKPQGSPGLSASDDAVRAVADQVWGRTDGRTLTEAAYGKGRVYWGRTPAEVARARNWAPDLDYGLARPETNLSWAHRTTGDADIYFVANQTGAAEALDVRFRTAGREAEIWRADTGAIKAASYRSANGRTVVPLKLDPYDAVFVVFRKPTTVAERVLPEPVEQTLATVDGGWTVAFAPDLGAPAKVEMPKLASWSENPDAGVRYFSGTATYTKTVTAPADWFRPGARVVLDLGTVRDVAEVSVNGKALGIAWKPPFKVDVTGALKPGANRLEVKVTNTWANRLIGDAQPGVKQTYTYVTTGPYPPATPLNPSGLLGPVTLSSVK